MEEAVTMYDVKVEIGTSKTDSTWTYSELAAGIENIAEVMNYVINKYQFMSNKGWGSTYVTGAHNEITLTGRRVRGDAAQDYIFGKKSKFDKDRETSLKITVTDNSGASAVTRIWTQDVVISDMQEYNGASPDKSAISIVLSCNGQPTESTSNASSNGG